MYIYTEPPAGRKEGPGLEWGLVLNVTDFYTPHNTDKRRTGTSQSIFKPTQTAKGQPNVDAESSISFTSTTLTQTHRSE